MKINYMIFPSIFLEINLKYLNLETNTIYLSMIMICTKLLGLVYFLKISSVFINLHFEL